MKQITTLKTIGLLFLTCTFLNVSPAYAEKITIAAAADMKYAMKDIVAAFQQTVPKDTVEVVYGSSGHAFTQIQQGAPYDLYFAADINYPRELGQKGFAATEPKLYAIGRITLWSSSRNATTMSLKSLLAQDIEHVAIANPKHAPYGKRAEEALRASGLWEKVEPKLVYGENIVQTAQFVQSGNAQVGIIALSLVLNPELAGKGGYWLIPDSLHEPLEQAFIITKRAENNTLAQRFAKYMESKEARAIMIRYGFVLPGETAAK
ncbi:MAG: molybdate ABC transporter substrate-binding protein [Deltaproteobacteria bacterium]|nr:molybdate ABC transporter substrate-binding protein [Deltaproteobacteria bacterium]